MWLGASLYVFAADVGNISPVFCWLGLCVLLCELCAFHWAKTLWVTALHFDRIWRVLEAPLLYLICEKFLQCAVLLMRFSCGVSLASNSHLFTVKVKGLYTVKFSDSWVKFFFIVWGCWALLSISDWDCVFSLWPLNLVARKVPSFCGIEIHYRSMDCTFVWAYKQDLYLVCLLFSLQR
jgi:hypothetical protein